MRSGVNANITHCWGESRLVAKSVMTFMLGQDLKAAFSWECNDGKQWSWLMWLNTVYLDVTRSLNKDWSAVVLTKHCSPLSPIWSIREVVVLYVDSGWLWFHAFYGVCVRACVCVKVDGGCSEQWWGIEFVLWVWALQTAVSYRAACELEVVFLQLISKGWDIFFNPCSVFFILDAVNSHYH